MGPDNSLEKPVVLFDGVCNLCNSSVQFIIKRDSNHKFQFASLQSEFAKEHLDNYLADVLDLKSIVLKEGTSVKVKSSAVLTIAKDLKGLWPLLYLFMVVPRFIRDGVYDYIAKNRYNWFGKKDQCMIPSPEMKSRFID